MNQVRAESAMPSSAGVEGRIWLLIVSHTDDKSGKMRTDEWEETLAGLIDSVSVREAVSVK